MKMDNIKLVRDWSHSPTTEKNREMKRNESQVFNSHDIPLTTLRQSETTLGFITTLGYHTSMVGSACK